MSITVEGQPVAGFLENVLGLAAEDPESFGLERRESNPNFTFEEVAHVLNRGSSSDRVLDERDRDYFVSRGLMTSQEFLVVANFLASPSLHTRFSTSPLLAREAAESAVRESHCEELEGRLRKDIPAGLAELFGLSVGPGGGFILGTALMIDGSHVIGDTIDYVRSGCANRE